MNSKLMIAIVLATACGKKSDAPAVPALTKTDVDAVNALIPPELKGKIEFEAGSIIDDFAHDKTTYAMVVPKGWKKAFMPASREPADADHFGSKMFGKTELRVGSNCDGDCTSKDWAAVVDKVYYKQFTSGQVTGKVLKDDKQKTRRTLVFQMEPTVNTNAGTMTATVNGTTTTSTVTSTSGDKGITIITTWWSDGASHHYMCEATLGEPAIGLAAAFEKVCAKVAVE